MRAYTLRVLPAARLSKFWLTSSTVKFPAVPSALGKAPCVPAGGLSSLVTKRACKNKPAS